MPAGMAILERFLGALGVAWVGEVESDESAVFAEVRGRVTALPATADVERAFGALGLVARSTRDETHPVGRHGELRSTIREYVARDAEARLRCTLIQNPDDARVALEWEALARPDIIGGVKEWRGRAWPAFFEAPRLYHESRELLILEGRLTADGFVACAARYRRWTAENGFLPHRSYEPDLDGDATWSDGRFVVALEDRGAGSVTLVVRDEGEAAG
jgi:hypothetical protein